MPTDINAKDPNNSKDDLSKSKLENEPAIEQSKTIGLIVAAVFYIVLGLTIAWFTKTGRAFLEEHWSWIAGLIGVLIILSAIPAVRRWLAKTTKRKVGIVIFAVIPLVIALVSAVVLLPPQYQVTALRAVFLLIVCLFPGMLYYLFIATRKYSLLYEFVTNLERLGLLKPRRLKTHGEEAENETKIARQQRVISYLQKFEAIYGPLQESLKDEVLKDSPGSSVLSIPTRGTTPSVFVSLFTSETTIPVVLATVLITLGWLVTLPPSPDIVMSQKFSKHLEKISEGFPPKELENRISYDSVKKEIILKLELSANEWNQLKVFSNDADYVKAIESLHETSTNVFSEGKWLIALIPERTPVYFAFLGAYFFSIQMLFRRFVLRDLGTNAYVALSLRIILAVIGTWVIVAGSKIIFDDPSENFLLILGFSIGVFPRVAWQFVQSAAKKTTGIVLESFQTELPITDLDGLTVWHEARLEEEDIENIPNMATADLVELILQTPFPPGRIIDWVDQAILYTHLGPEVNKNSSPSARERLRSHGVRTASSLIKAYEESERRKDLEIFENILPHDVGHPIRSLVDTMKTNPNLELIHRWRGLSVNL